jgi:hypothetical protein
MNDFCCAKRTAAGLCRERRVMLYMVIERFRDLNKIAERFRTHGRMMPDGLNYNASWLDPEGIRCFQIMETGNQQLLHEWMSRWDDLVDFEVHPVLTSAEFWAKRNTG